jgi:hypothetical protein
MGNSTPKLPESLRTRVLTSIRQEERHRARTYLFTSAAVMVGSSAGVFISVTYLAQTLAQSSFWSYLSLLFSDTDVALAYAEPFLFSLAEALPLLGVTAVLATTLLLLGALRVFILNIRSGFISSFNNA